MAPSTGDRRASISTKLMLNPLLAWPICVVPVEQRSSFLRADMFDKSRASYVGLSVVASVMSMFAAQKLLLLYFVE